MEVRQIVEYGSDVQVHIRGIWLLYPCENLTSRDVLCINLRWFGYLHHFLYDALVTADDMSSIMCFLIIYTPVLHRLVIHGWTVKRILCIVIQECLV